MISTSTSLTAFAEAYCVPTKRKPGSFVFKILLRRLLIMSFYSDDSLKKRSRSILTNCGISFVSFSSMDLAAAQFFLVSLVDLIFSYEPEVCGCCGSVFSGFF